MRKGKITAKFQSLKSVLIEEWYTGIFITQFKKFRDVRDTTSIAEVYKTTFLGFPSIYVFLLWFLYIRFCRIFLRFLFPSSISPEKNVCTKIPLNCKLANKKTWLLALKVGFLSSGKRQRIFLHKNRAPSRKISLFWVFKMVAVSLFRGTNVAVTTSCENPRFQRYDHSWSPSECTHLIKCGIICTLFYLRFFVLICHRDPHNRVNVASRQLTALKHLDSYLKMKPSKINSISGLFLFLPFSEVDS